MQCQQCFYYNIGEHTKSDSFIPPSKTVFVKADICWKDIYLHLYTHKINNSAKIVDCCGAVSDSRRRVSGFDSQRAPSVVSLSKTLYPYYLSTDFYPGRLRLDTHKKRVLQ